MKRPTELYGYHTTISATIKNVSFLNEHTASVRFLTNKQAMYLGHQSIASTAYYLHWIPEIARTASNQFERRFGHLIEGEAA